MNSLQLNILILLLGGLQGIFLFTLLYKKKKSLPGYPFLAAYLAVLILQIVMKLASKLWLMETMRPLYVLSYYLPFLYGPLIWIFVRQSIEKFSLHKRGLLHFFPFILLFICCLPGVLSILPFLILPLISTKSVMIGELASLAVYHGSAFYILKKNITSSSFTPHKEKLIWLRQFIIISFFVCSVIAIVMCLMYYNYPRMQYLRFAFSALTIFIYWASYQAWSQPELFNVILGGAGQQNKITSGRAIHPVKKYSNSGLHKDDMQKIILALKNKLQADKCYLDPGLTIDELAAGLDCSRHHLSQAMNDVLGQSFYDCINHYRVEEAKILLGNPERASYKIASLAFDAGFNSISTFNDVFKKSTGLTPSQFRKQREENDLRKQRV